MRKMHDQSIICILHKTSKDQIKNGEAAGIQHGWKYAKCIYSFCWKPKRRWEDKSKYILENGCGCGYSRPA
jgi:hypothetical protein